ncbi:MAG: 2-(1,2-epoxy-1,2-dihydrophenyl)acetyl-CoA isomerase [Hyphobacterium sp.]|nr:MAG: 2-(1,2-epoxy-1,2-dihydrophenyl)acetyl-CoA isomerase [Hyphobacterium sp.]
MTREPVVRRTVRDNATWLTLSRPGRGNSLTLDVLDQLRSAINTLPTGQPVVLTGDGAAFSTGGDILPFLQHAGDPDGLRDYARRLVGALNETLLTLHAREFPLIAAVNGPVTGGSLGLALIADRIVMARSAFVQPYYGVMGFAPDGGWTALLPDRIGVAQTRAWIANDTRRSGEACFRLGVCDSVIDDDSFDAAVAAEIARLQSLDAGVLSTTRQLLGPDRNTLAKALDAECEAFIAQITRAETIARMRAFAANGKMVRGK